MHPRYSSSMNFSGAMKIPFFKASLLRKRRAVDKSKSKYEWSEWSKRTYTKYIVSYHCKVGIMLCILDTLASSIHFSGAMKLTFFKASLLRKLRAFDNRKRKFEWSEWSKRTYTFYSKLPL